MTEDIATNSLKYTKILLAQCPSEVKETSRSEWAIQVEKELIFLHRNDNDKGRKFQGHIKSIINNLKTNGSYLSKFSVSELVKLNTTEMIANTSRGKKRLNILT